MSKERELLNRSRYNLDREYCADLIDEIEAALAQPEQEPVAWIIETEIEGKLSEWVCTDKKHYMDASDGKDPIPLYLAPPKREPLSDYATYDMFRASKQAVTASCYWAGIRDAEKAHGIGGGE